jgi:stage II sporulation protein D
VKHARVARSLLSLMAAVAVLWCGIEPGSTPIVGATAKNAAPTEARTTLRVGMWTRWHDREVALTPSAVEDHTLLRSCERCSAEVLRTLARIRADGNGIALTMAGRTAHFDGVWLAGTFTLTAHGENVTLHNPATITARRGVLVIVVTMPVESYVERVVASESGTADSEASLRALATVVRSFALHEAHGHADYDLCDSTHCQLLHWSGISERGPAAHKAALATAGETLWFHGQRALAYFGKDCGGRTASPDEIWPRAKPAPYLPSQPDRFCTAGGGREWASEITRAELSAVLAARGLASPGWQNLTVARRGQSGRAVTLKLDAMEISAEEFRLAVGESLGWNRIPSTWFEVSRQGDRFDIHGRGWGHGVGLCQKGAAVMAQQGRSAEQILDQYFPGSRTADEATGREWKTFLGDGFSVESLDSDDSAYLAELNRARAEAAQLSGLNAASRFTVRAFVSTPAFRDATLAPGWVAAFTEGDWIGTQPLRTLDARQLLEATMRHEFLHALVEQQAGPRAPIWLREGLVEVWSKQSRDGNAARRPIMELDAVDAALAHATTEAESMVAHSAARWYTAQVLTHYGRAQVLEWLRSGVPASVAAALRQR